MGQSLLNKIIRLNYMDDPIEQLICNEVRTHVSFSNTMKVSSRIGMTNQSIEKSLSFHAMLGLGYRRPLA